MKKIIFYSWQSDLPNNQNRSFIETCLKRTLKEIKSEVVSLDVVIDRDTKDVIGTPDISASIFSKIDKCSIFIADISFINSQYGGRLTPNPNVLIELGYAAKTIGWNNIICVFNNEYGKVENLPFDLRFRRPLTYRVNETSNKAVERKKLTKTLKTAIHSIIQSENETDDITNYIKQQIDKEILTICNHIFKIFYGYESKYTLESILEMIEQNPDEIQRQLFERKHIGFTILKDWKIYIEKLDKIMNQPFFTQNASKTHISSLIKIIREIEIMALIQTKKNLFNPIGIKETNYFVVDGKKMNPDNPNDGHLLLKKLDGKKGVVTDFGTIRKYNVKNTLEYHTVSNELFMNWCNSFEKIFKSIDMWIEKTGNYLIIDPLTFRMY